MPASKTEIRQITEAPLSVPRETSTVPTRASGSPRRVLLNDLKLPPELKQIVSDRCRRQGVQSRNAREHLEREIKLQHFFGGQDVAYLPTAEGVVIVAVGDLSSPAFGRELDALDANERRRVTLYSPEPWNASTTLILTPSAHET